MEHRAEPSHSAGYWTGALLAAALLPALAIASCSGQETPDSRAPAPTQSATGSAAPALSSLPAGSSSSAAAPPPDASAVDAAAQLQEQARKARDCQSPRSVLIGKPDGGVVFNNAMTSVDAGFIDRTRGVLDAIDGQSQHVRCCFDTGANDGSEARAMLVVTLDAKGAVSEAHIDPARSTELAALTRLCIEQAAQSASYPSSPTNKTTVVEYLFKVQLPPATAP